MKRRNVYLVSVAGVALVAGVIISTQLAKNNLYGYLTEGEYASIEAPSNYTESDGFIPSAPIDGTIQDQINENLTYTLADLETWQLDIFKDTSTLFIDEIKSHTSTIEQVDQRQNGIIEAQMIENIFPSNAIQLFNEWKVENGYYNQFTEDDTQQQVTDQQPQQNQQTQQNQQSNQNQQGQTETSKPAPPVNHDTPSQGNKPQPSTEQQQTQTKPSTPQQGPSEESIREAMEGGGEGGYVDFENGLVDEFIPIE